jgi:NADH dehydrogenase
MSLLLETKSPLVTVFGGSGFVGRYVVHRMVKLGFRVRVAVRNPNDALFLKTYGEVGQVEIVNTNILNEEAVSASLRLADYAVNCVAGLLNETEYKKSKLIYVKGSKIVAKIAKKQGIKKLIHISSLGVDIKSDSFYSRYKAEGELEVFKYFKNAIILRPSLVFGFEDKFFNRFASVASVFPMVPIFGSKTKFQPIFVDDLAYAVQMAIIKKNITGVFEIAGSEVFSFKELMEKMLKIIRRKKIILSLPFFFGYFLAFLFKILKWSTFGLFSPPLTSDNIKDLMKDNIVVQGKQKTIEDLGIKPKGLDIILPKYLYSFRPYGQYSDIKDSVKNL